jgi:8-oxo-dGTP diphosphatase
MRVIKIVDKRDYLDSWERIERNSVRAIIIKNDKIALVYSIKEGFYKFPGGGIEEDEEHIETLMRETLEETGLHIKENTIKEFGFYVECRKSLYEDAIFEHKSYYYSAEVDDIVSAINLNEYEKELEYELRWVEIQDAIKTNKAFKNNEEYTYITRETTVLNELASNNPPKRVYLSY